MLGYIGAAADDIKNITESLTSSAVKVADTVKQIKSGNKQAPVIMPAPQGGLPSWLMTGTGIAAAAIAGYFIWKAYKKK